MDDERSTIDARLTVTANNVYAYEQQRKAGKIAVGERQRCQQAT